MGNTMNTRTSLKPSVFKSGKSLKEVIPILLGTLLLISLADAAIPKSFYIKVFQRSGIFASLVGALIGSISAGNPITSYILGGEMLKEGVGLIAVTAFLLAWVTVGLIQLPAEAMILGKKFAIVRNLSAFVLAIILAFIVAFLMHIL